MFTLLFKLVPNKYHDLTVSIVLIIANIIDVLAVLLMAVYFNKFLIVLYAVIAAMLIRINMGEHYDTWLECFVSGLLIYTIYAIVSLMVNNLAVDLILGFILGVYMVDFNSEKARRLLKKGRP